MKQAYFDESSDGEVFLIAGWIAAAEGWERFNEDWRRTMAAAPAIRYFKHHEAMSFEGEFHGWTEEDRDAKVMAMAEVIARYDVFGMSGGIKLSTWNKIFDGKAATRKELRNVLKFTEPYEACFHGVVATTLQHEAEKGKEVVNFIFDEQTGLLKKHIALYEEFKANPDKFPFPAELRDIAGSITETSDGGVPGLQAADLLAGQFVVNLKRGAIPKPLLMLSSKRQIGMFQCFPPEFEKILGLAESADLLLQMKAQLKEEKRRLVSEGKWEWEEGERRD